MRRSLLLALLAAGGCLPAYENPFLLQNLDAGVPSDGGAGDGSMDAAVLGSGVKIVGAAFSLEQEKKAPGPVVYIEGFPQFASMPADNLGGVAFEIPKSINDDPMATYNIVVDGMSQGKPILKTTIVPKIRLNPQGMNNLFHFYENQDDGKGIRGTIAAALEKHGDLVAAQFADTYTFGEGSIAQVTDTGLNRYRGYTVVVDGNTANDSCTTKCCAYYTTQYNAWEKSADPKPDFIDFARTSATAPYNYYAIVCPISVGKAEVVLTQTSTNVFDQFGQPPPTPFQPIMVPLKVKEGVHIEWRIY